MSRSMIAALVAGVPSPLSFIACLSSSSSTSFPAVSIAPSKAASEYLGGGLVSPSLTPTFATSHSSPTAMEDRKSTRLNSSHTVIYTLSLHDALPIFHCPEQGGLRVPWRRLGLPLLDAYFRHIPLLAHSNGRQHRRLLLLPTADAFRVERAPSGFEHYPAPAKERLLLHLRDDGGVLEAGSREENGEEAPRYQIVDPRFVGRKLPRELLSRRDDGVVVRHLRIVHDALVYWQLREREELLGERFEAGQGSRCLDPLLQAAYHILREVAARGSGVGDELPFLVERLGRAQRALRGEAEPRVGISL